MESVAILVYGSLINLSELRQLYQSIDYVPVMVQGFRRHWRQEATWREGENGEKAVLTVSEGENSRINALLIEGLTKDEYKEYTNREKGYEIHVVDPNRISFYNKKWNLSRIDSILTAVGKRPLNNPKPIPSYINLCVQGAFDHGPEFGVDFIQTTEWP